MNRVLDKILGWKLEILRKQVTVIDALFLICIVTFSLQVRLALFPNISGDYVGFLEPWMSEIRRLDGLKSLGHEISNYSSAYMILMSLLSYIPADPLYLLKSLSVFFDYAAAVAMFLIVYELTGHIRKAILGLGCFLLAPTFFLNSAYWCQCDIIYVSFLLFGFYSFLKGKSGKTLLFTAIGFAFKLQALFILPFYIIMWLCPYRASQGAIKEVRLRDFLVLPLPYLLLTLPGILLGRDPWNSIGVYLEQTNSYPWLTLNYPNLYSFFGQTYQNAYQISELGEAGVYLTILCLGCLAYYLYVKKVRMGKELMITTALLSLCLILYCLPYMHERYGMLIDVFAILYGILRPRKIPVAIGLLISSLLAYMLFLFGTIGLSYITHSLLQLGLVTMVGMDLYKQTSALKR